VPVRIGDRVVALAQGVTPPLVIADLSVSSQGTRFASHAQAVIFSGTMPGGANNYSRNRILIPARTTISGVGFVNGATINGSVRVGLHDETGTELLAQKSSNVAQAGADTVQEVAFDSAITVDPGLYYTGVISSSATATFYKAYSAELANHGGSGVMVVPASITLPTAPGIEVLTHTF
jgi:hypothetical protein